MNRARIILFIFISIFSYGHTLFAEAVSYPDRGVSEGLASERKNKISSLSYTITFDIPSDQQKEIYGKADIEFSYQPVENGWLILDFKTKGNSVGKVIVNDETVEPTVVNEHIIVPDSCLRKGHNDVTVEFMSDDRSMNRRADLLYTLFVPDRARTVFPCFDQPDLKAKFNLNLIIPEHWKAVSNTVVVSECELGEGRKIIKFGETEPLSTYLFAFAAGKFEYVAGVPENGNIGVYHRENDSLKVAQIPEIVRQINYSLNWLETFTGVKYPFVKYDIVILPGFQFGGMEHTGATFYNDTRMFLGRNATPEDEMRRTSLIAHETTHMWFGDYVTMEWFNDVWMKEVFANYFAAAITRELLPEFDHDLEWMRTYSTAAYSEDRSSGGTSIRQKLDNMKNAGLIYNNIIYNKAPLMLEKLVEIIGEERFRDAIREYVVTYGYGNATWDDLVEILVRNAGNDVEQFSRAWVYCPGMPVVSFSKKGAKIAISQTDSREGNVFRRQQFTIALIDSEGRVEEIEVVMPGDGSIGEVEIPLSMIDKDFTIVPNFNGKGYGLFLTENGNFLKLLDLLKSGKALQWSGVSRFATFQNLNENWLFGKIDTEKWVDVILSSIKTEKDPLGAATLIGYLVEPMMTMENDERMTFEKQLMEIAETHDSKSVRTSAMRRLIENAISPDILMTLMEIFENGESPILNERDFMDLSWQLALCFPDKSGEILSKQRQRLTNQDRIAEYDFVSRAVGDRPMRDSLFLELLTPEGQSVEPWAISAMSLLCCPRLGEEPIERIRPALDKLETIQTTGDIFFPANWCKALLGKQRSAEAQKIVTVFLKENELMNPLLKNKILNGAYYLGRKKL